MSMNKIVTHLAVGCAGIFAGYFAATGDLGVLPSFAQAPAAPSGQRSTELFNRVMDDVLGRRLTVRLTENPVTAAPRIGTLEATPSATSSKGPMR
jgi:hypothetical protein